MIYFKKFLQIFNSITKKIIFFPLNLIFVIILIMISPLFLVRIGRFRSDKIGHLSLEYEIHLAEKKLKIIKKKNQFDIWFKDNIITNNYLFNIRKNQFFIVPNLFFKETYYLLKFLKLQNKFICDRFYSDSDVNNVLDKTKPSFQISKKEIDNNLNFLKKIGLKKNQKIITIHLRDSAFRGLHEMTDYRNIYNFQDYYKSINYLINKGFFVIRTGQKVNYKFKIKNKNFLDYPFSNLKSEIMDMVIAKNSFFCISSGSGFDGIVRAFRKPVLFVNFSPIGYFQSYGSQNMTIFKHFKDKISKKFLSLDEILNKDIIYCSDGRVLKKKNIQVEENSEIEIKNAIIDMINFLNKKFDNKKYNLFNNRINKFFIEKIKSKNKHTTHFNIRSKIAPSFLKKNSYLI